MNIIIIDDHPIFRRGLREIIAEQPNHQVVGEAGDGVNGLDLIQRTKPDIAIVDIDLPKIDGIELTRQAGQRDAAPQIIILTMSKNESIFNEVIDLGVRGYVLKDDAASDILTSLEAVAEGRTFVSASISGLLLRRRNRARDLVRQKPAIEDLTPMQRRVLKLIAQNKTTKEIAAELFISPFTVETHRCNICARLNLGGFQPVLRFALEHRSAL